MTKVLHVRNVNDAFVEGLWHLKIEGIHEDTRNGPCLVAPGPVITEYRNPQERILWEPRRDANPVFHLMESIWMIAGQRSVNWLLQFNSRFSEYAEPNGLQWGAYGYRWRKWFGVDQIFQTVRHLRRSPNSRRCVIGMWDPNFDMDANTRDIPCNTHIYLDLRGGVLNMTVCCRSNDMLWGAYGANAVHFSILQELIAHELDVPVGIYRQMSNNFHIYTDLPMVKSFLEDPPFDIATARPMDHYSYLPRTPLLYDDETLDDWVEDAEALVAGNMVNFHTRFFTCTAEPLFHLYTERKAGREINLQDVLDPENDWHLAFSQWLGRREQK